MKGTVALLAACLGCAGSNPPARRQFEPTGPLLTANRPLDVNIVEIKKYRVDAFGSVRYVLRIGMGTTNRLDNHVRAEVLIEDRTFDARIIRLEQTTSVLVVDLPADVDPRTSVVRLFPHPP